MCSSAAMMVCVYMNSTPHTPVRDVSAGKLEEIMSIAASFHGEHFPNIMATLEEVIRVSGLYERANTPSSSIKISNMTEIAGLTRDTPSDMASQTCLDLCAAIRTMSQSTCYAITSRGHTISMGFKKGVYWLCDSLQGCFHTTSDLQRFLKIVTQKMGLGAARDAFSGVKFA